MMTTSHVIDGAAIAATVRANVAAAVARRSTAGQQPPGLATILIGDDPASAVYVAAKQRRCEEGGIFGFDHRLHASVSAAEVADLIGSLNNDPRVSGILCQLPLPSHLDATALIELIDPAKDVDGLTAVSAGRLALGLPGLRPCTPSGVMVLLEHAGVALAGVQAAVLGRSNLFGKPMAQMLLGADATVTVCHSRTANLAEVCRTADVLIAAAGRPGLVTVQHVKLGATVIDVGINQGDGGLVGDVDFDAVASVAGRVSPVPGGVGPMTIACLLRNTLQAAADQRHGHEGSRSSPVPTS